MYQLETVKIEHPDGYQVINKTDFDPDLHVLHESESLGVQESELSDDQESGGLPPENQLSEQVTTPANRSRKKA